ncbi:hypothetical protein D9613_009783 [Agrocybe pediades]|uniref:Nephrocystin 3-like N-terminal domain-containing protein n=1 Tax=Agrocybe pediades TaxID=84607 RepID=A0A8H4QY91_9AGAR|nr:hypothetical protein D9613_009783 [Agrocybe pediades]
MSQPGPHANPKFLQIERSIVAGGTFTQHIDNRHYTLRSGENVGYAILRENVATAAMHDSIHVVDPPKCHPNTRVAIIQSVIDWTKGVLDEEINRKPIIWLNGAAGAGKSAIARSVAERCFEEGLLLGSFFFAAADPTRNHVRGLVATICYQMCKTLPGFCDIVSPLIANDPLIFSSSITTQLITLIFDPLCRLILSDHSGPTKFPRLIIIDGLDECSESMDQKNLLLALQEATRSTTLIRFFVCSRPENHINAAFCLPPMANIFYKIFLDEDHSGWVDIWHYLEDKFAEIKEGHVFKHTLPAAWPTFGMVNDLVSKSSGQFIYASTVIKYIESPRHRPNQRLEAIFNLQEPAFKDLPFTQLDALYRHVISKAENLPKVLDILAFPALYGNPSAESIEVILQLQEGDVEIMLADLQSIVRVGVWPIPHGIQVWFLHKSLTDFLSDRQRAGELYQDLLAARLQHIARIISIFSVGSRAQRVDLQGPLKNTTHLSRDILQAAQQFPMFKFIKCPLLVDNGRGPQSDWFDSVFLMDYIEYLCGIKNVSEATNLVYMEQMSQYCKGVLSALEDDFSDIVPKQNSSLATPRHIRKRYALYPQHQWF